jgi:hypothetical protein
MPDPGTGPLLSRISGSVPEVGSDPVSFGNKEKMKKKLVID